jgi:hypothetical protein
MAYGMALVGIHCCFFSIILAMALVVAFSMAAACVVVSSHEWLAR